MGARDYTIRWTPEADGGLRGELLAGATLRDAGASVGVAAVTAMRRANTLGIDRRRRSKVSHAQVIALHSAGMKQSAIARLLGVTRQAVSRIVLNDKREAV